MSDLVPKLPEPVLPALPTTILPAISELTASLGIPRHVLARDEEIQYAWRDLPRELREIHQIFVVNWSPECVLLSALAYLMGQ